MGHAPYKTACLVRRKGEPLQGQVLVRSPPLARLTLTTGLGIEGGGQALISPIFRVYKAISSRSE